MKKERKLQKELVIYQVKNGAIAFRGDFSRDTIWATKILKQHITEGYTINRKIIGKNYDYFIKAVSDVERLLPLYNNL